MGMADVRRELAEEASRRAQELAEAQAARAAESEARANARATQAEATTKEAVASNRQAMNRQKLAETQMAEVEKKLDEAEAQQALATVEAERKLDEANVTATRAKKQKALAEAQIAEFEKKLFDAKKELALATSEAEKKLDAAAANAARANHLHSLADSRAAIAEEKRNQAVAAAAHAEENQALADARAAEAEKGQREAGVTAAEAIDQQTLAYARAFEAEKKLREMDKKVRQAQKKRTQASAQKAEAEQRADRAQAKEALETQRANDAQEVAHKAAARKVQAELDAVKKVAEDNESLANNLKEELQLLLKGEVSWNPLQFIFRSPPDIPSPRSSGRLARGILEDTMSIHLLPFHSLEPTSLKERLQFLLREAAHEGDGSRCNVMKRAVVQRVEHICEMTLLRNYLRSKQAMCEENRKFAVKVPSISPPVSKVISDAFPEITLDDDVGEQLLLHGTSALEHIKQQGFDERCARESGLYGWGVYFTDESCKAFQYSKNTHEHCMILARVALGDPFYAEGRMMSQKRAPQRRDHKCLFGSIIANVGIPNGQSLGTQQHREFVVFDGKRAYPDLAVYFTTD